MIKLSLGKDPSRSILRMTLSAFAAGAMIVSRLCAAEPFSPVGLWKTFDDHSSKPRALVRVYEQDGRYFGRIDATLVPGEGDEVCEACEDERKNQPIVGLVIMRNIRQSGADYRDGDILDPETGGVYGCEFHLDHDGSQMIVRGFIGLSLFGRSQTWVRAE